MQQRYPKVGDKVNVIQKIHYTTGELTTGVVKDILTRSRFHPRGHKVRLTNGIIGRIQSYADEVGPQSQLISSTTSTPQTHESKPLDPSYFDDPDILI